MKKITKLSELKKLDKAQLLDEMMKGTIKGGSSCGMFEVIDDPADLTHFMLDIA